MSINDVFISCDYCGKRKEAEDAVCADCFKALESDKSDLEEQAKDMAVKIKDLTIENEALKDEIAELKAGGE
jgi:predicted nuclease with TOPRIM domain